MALANFVGCASKPASPLANVLLLGEVHDNPDGHRQRYEYLRKLVERGWRPTIAMEQFDRERQDTLTKAQASCDHAACVIHMAGGKGWRWSYYHPIIDLALDYHLPLVAANVSREDAVRVIEKGFHSALDSKTIETFKLHEPLPADLLKAQSLAIDAGHCGKLPASMVEGMVNAQVVRDVWMAKTVAENLQSGVVLIAGNGHVRRDIGVARWMLAIDASRVESHGYVEPDSAPQDLLYDFAHVITPHQRSNPCGPALGPF